MVFSLLLLPISTFGDEDKKEEKEEVLTPDQRLLDDLRKSFFGEREMLEKYFQKDFIDKVDKMFKDSIKDFDGDIQTYPSGFTGFQAGVWKKEKKGMVLFIEGLDPQKGKFDVTMAKGTVSIKGSVERSLGAYGKTMMNFSNSFPVPMGCNGEKMTLEPRENGLAVVFPWIDPKEGENIKVIPQKIPVQKDDNDITI